MKVDELYNRHLQRIETHRRTYKSIQRLCEAHIRMINENGGMQTTFDVPPLIYGEPMYDQERAAEFVVRRLTKGGFRAFREKWRIHIDWRPDRTTAKTLSKKAGDVTTSSASNTSSDTPWIQYTVPQLEERKASIKSSPCPEIRTIQLSNDRLESHIRNLGRSSRG